MKGFNIKGEKLPKDFGSREEGFWSDGTPCKKEDFIRWDFQDLFPNKIRAHSYKYLSKFIRDLIKDNNTTAIQCIVDNFRLAELKEMSVDITKKDLNNLPKEHKVFDFKIKEEI